MPSTPPPNAQAPERAARLRHMQKTWTDHPDPLGRLENEVHVWLVEPEAVTNSDSLSLCHSVLAADERQRYERFYFERDRRHYLLAHALVRLALSGYAGVDPADWRFSANARGRPVIASPDVAPGLRFSLTHTAGLCACLVSMRRDCGIDAENMSRDHDLKKVAGRMFAPQEREAMNRLVASDVRERFFRHWTLREAYAKALGTGLAGLPGDFHFESADADRPRVIFDRNGGRADQWQFALLRPTNLHMLALAVHRPGEADLQIVTRTMDL